MFPKEMQELIKLVDEYKWHRKWYRNCRRVNTTDNPEHISLDKGGRRWLKYKYAPRSNTVRAGPILEYIQKSFPWANAVCLNRKNATSPPMTAHRDKGNNSESFITFWVDFDNSNNQGAICLRDGTIFSEKGVWHGPFRGDQMTHWVLPHKTGIRFSCITFRTS